MVQSRPRAVIEALRARIRAMEAAAPTRRDVLPFGVEDLDAALPEGGLALGALHEVAGGGAGALDGAAAVLFTAGVVARTQGLVLWRLTRPDLFAPALGQAGLDPDRILYAEAADDKTVLACFEEGRRHGGLRAVVAEVARLSPTAPRRLQLAAETSGAIGIAVRRWRRQTDAADFGQPTAAVTRWRISALPAAPLPASGRRPGRAAGRPLARSAAPAVGAAAPPLRRSSRSPGAAAPRSHPPTGAMPRSADRRSRPPSRRWRRPASAMRDDGRGHARRRAFRPSRRTPECRLLSDVG